jgi:DNA-binding PadR family transcriptional regulator
MVRSVPSPATFRRRLVGLYALTLMERDGPLHGYGLSERIAEKTEGAWRPGPGSVYPSLRKLTEFGLARSQAKDRRREYTITPRGRALLDRVRHHDGPAGRPRPDLSSLWAEVIGSGNVDQFLVSRLRRTVDSMVARIERPAGAGPRSVALRTDALAELARATRRIRAASARPPGAARRARGV